MQVKKLPSPELFAFCAIARMAEIRAERRLPRQIEPKEVVVARPMDAVTAPEQQPVHRSGWNHQVAIAPQLVT